MRDLRKLTKKEITWQYEEIVEELKDICDREHSSCNNECPVFKLNGGVVLPDTSPFESGCACFKDGFKMLEFIHE